MWQTSKVVPVKNQIRAIFPQLQLRPNFDTLDTNTGDIHQILNTLKYTYETILFSWEGSRTERTGGVATRSNWFVLVSLEFVKVGSEGQFPPKKNACDIMRQIYRFFLECPPLFSKGTQSPMSFKLLAMIHINLELFKVLKSQIILIHLGKDDIW